MNPALRGESANTAVADGTPFTLVRDVNSALRGESAA